ncbi:RNA-binding (RRM/RBD/RNP motifs) family protein [Actinidia rufa]|uniref:RNA-binding (RRM/RBD/RNP motifs) family protein n=1 Tax=Actinidia rufa TaxID=165716 RepID=A0A7J0G9N7_9ERIC|nr:RNA-binding (RRM/RBD/RNP motifs) family protein [Actinidia rufa]
MMQPGNGVVPQQMPPPSYNQQQQYQQPPPPQQWMMPPPPPQQQAFQPQLQPQYWTQQAAVPPPQQAQPPQQQQQQQYSSEQTTGGSDEIKSLWIGDLQYWMDESYIINCFAQTGERQKRMLQTYNGSLMPNSEQNFRLNWATLGSGERRADDGPDYTIFVGDLAADVTDYLLLETFKPHYSSLKGAKVVTDRLTGRTKGYGFVRFGDESEQLRAMTEMNGVLCSTRPMRIGPAATKKPAGTQQYQKATYQNPQASQGESDPNNTTIFVGALDDSVKDEHLRQVFGQFGELVHVKIPANKRCGFVQFADRACAEQALSMLNGTPLGGQNIRLSWGRSPSNKQTQSDQTQWNGGYYGYAPQGYESYGYAPPPQDPNMYYGGYPGYGNYQQPQQS